MASQLHYYQFPGSTSDYAAIPLSIQAVPLAILGFTVSENGLILLRGSVGWKITATPEQQNQVSTLFKIWRGAPLTGDLIYSIRDSGESWAESNKITSFSHIDSGFLNAQSVSYTLTAELPTGGGAEVSGFLTFTASEVTLV